MPYQYLIPAAVEGLSTGIKYATRKKRKPFSITGYGRGLKKRSMEGLYPPAIKSKLLGLRAGVEGNVAGMNTATIRGNLVAGGIPQGSIAGRATLAKPGLGLQRSIGEYEIGRASCRERV